MLDREEPPIDEPFDFRPSLLKMLEVDHLLRFGGDLSDTLLDDCLACSTRESMDARAAAFKPRGDEAGWLSGAEGAVDFDEAPVKMEARVEMETEWRDLRFASWESAACSGSLLMIAEQAVRSHAG